LRANNIIGIIVGVLKTGRLITLYCACHYNSYVYFITNLAFNKIRGFVFAGLFTRSMRYVYLEPD
jgi:hypothetical protein